MSESELLRNTVSSAPIGVLVVDASRKVLVSNTLVAGMGMVREGVLDDRLWVATERTLATGEDSEIDLSAPGVWPGAEPASRSTPRSGCSANSPLGSR